MVTALSVYAFVQQTRSLRESPVLARRKFILTYIRDNHGGLIRIARGATLDVGI